MKKIFSVLLVVVLNITSLVIGNVSCGAVSKIKKNKSDFYLKLNKTIYDEGYKHTYKIYSFNVNSKSAKSYNKKLYKYFNKYYKDDYNAYVGNYSLVFYITGSTYKNGNILSIKQKVTGSSWWRYKSYNINKNTGKKVTTSKLYKKFGYSKKSFYKALKNKQIKKIKKIIKNSPGLANYAGKMIAYAKSAKSRKGLQTYLDGKGNLCVVAKLNTYAGAGIYQYVFQL